jgi:hypothetical protein
MWKYLAEKLRYGQRDDPESVGYLARVDGMVKRVREELLKIEKKDERAGKIQGTVEKMGVQKRRLSQRNSHGESSSI